MQLLTSSSLELGHRDLSERATAPAWLPWALASAGWLLFGFLYANLVYLGMMDHGHSWWRLVLWQLVIWGAWALLAPIAFALTGRVPVEPTWRAWRPVAAHVLGAVLLAHLHLVPVALATSRLTPFAPLAEPVTFAEAYQQATKSWLRLDVAIYAGLVAAATALSYRRRYRERELAASRLEASLALARLEALEMQLQPHFLFNALNAATSLVRAGQRDAAADVLVGLAGLLRHLLEQRGQQLVPLASELAFAERYLDVQQARFEERLEVRFEVEDEARAVLVPSLVLQPLLENAVEHGVAGSSRPGLVRLTARRLGDDLELVVENTTGGSPADGREGFGIGLATTRSRLLALFGDVASLLVEPLAENAFRATLRIPWRGAPPGADG